MELLIYKNKVKKYFFFEQFSISNWKEKIRENLVISSNFVNQVTSYKLQS